MARHILVPGSDSIAQRNNDRFSWYESKTKRGNRMRTSAEMSAEGRRCLWIVCHKCDKFPFNRRHVERSRRRDFLPIYRQRHAMDLLSSREQCLCSQINRTESDYVGFANWAFVPPSLPPFVCRYRRALDDCSAFEVYTLSSFCFVYDAWSANYLTTMWINAIVITETVKEGNESLFHSLFSLFGRYSAGLLDWLRTFHDIDSEFSLSFNAFPLSSWNYCDARQHIRDNKGHLNPRQHNTYKYLVLAPNVFTIVSDFDLFYMLFRRCWRQFFVDVDKDELFASSSASPDGRQTAVTITLPCEERSNLILSRKQVRSPLSLRTFPRFWGMSAGLSGRSEATCTLSDCGMIK